MARSGLGSGSRKSASNGICSISQNKISVERHVSCGDYLQTVEVQEVDGIRGLDRHPLSPTPAKQLFVDVSRHDIQSPFKDGFSIFGVHKPERVRGFDSKA